MLERRSLVLVSLLAAGACAGPDGHFNAPPVAPVVREATPAALRPLATAGPSAPAGKAAGARAVEQVLADIFTARFGKMSGGEAQGLVNSALEDLDGRMAEVDGRGSQGDCLGQAPVRHVVDLSAVAPSLRLAMNVQCRDVFTPGNGNLAGAGSGLVFGRRAALPPRDAGAADAGVEEASLGDDFSLWLTLIQPNGVDAFAYFANVLDAHGPGKTVDFLFLEAWTGRVAAYRVKATPARGAFELVFAASEAGSWATPGPDPFRCGFRMISDSAHVWAEGGELTAGTCADAAPFAACLDATSLAGAPAGACAALRGGFTMTAPTAAELAGAGPAFAAALALATTDGETTPF